MKRHTYDDWTNYWSKFNDLKVLQKKFDDIDGTLIALEKECGTKLLAGDHMLIISTLENRIEYLEQNLPRVESTGQIAMFAA